MNLRELLPGLDTFQDQLRLDDLHQLRVNIGVIPFDVQNQIIFQAERYQRNLVRFGLYYYALVMTRQSSQQSPFHDHRTAPCAVKVLLSTATGIRFQGSTDGALAIADTSRFATGTACGSVGANIHQTRNDAPEKLVTLHLYWRFLNNPDVYSPEETSVQFFTNPTVERLGKKQENLLRRGHI